MPTTQESQRREVKAPLGLNDPDVVIPPSVRAAAARAEALHKSVYPAADETPSSPAAPDQTKVREGTNASERQAKEDTPLAGASTPTPVTEAPAPTSVPKTPAQAPAIPKLPPPEDSWEHKYASIKGRYDKSQNDIRQMADQITNLQNVLATMNSAPSAPSTPLQVPRELQAASLLTPQEVSDYGEEFLNVVGKKAREIYSPLVINLQNKVAELEQKLGAVGSNLTQTSRTRMFTDLDAALPNWRQINESQEFLRWLALPDVYSGAIRLNLLRAAWDRNDTARSLAFFRGFLAEEVAAAPAVGSTDGSQAPQRNVPGQQNGKASLEQYAAPGRARSAAELPAEKPLITRSQISRFYADCAAGKYRGNEAERAQHEAMIFAAQADNRIVN